MEDQLELTQVEKDNLSTTLSRITDELNKTKRTLTSTVDSAEFEKLRSELDQTKTDLASCEHHRRQLKKELNEKTQEPAKLRDEIIKLSGTVEFQQNSLSGFAQKRNGFDKMALEFGETLDQLEITKVLSCFIIYFLSSCHLP